MDTFDKLGIRASTVNGLKELGIVTPTDIQEKAIPLALENRDIIGQSQTGSGKTFAYLLPLYEKIDSSKREMQAIILAPTHELVMQIDKQIKSLSECSSIPITSTTIIGEVNIKRQIEKLKEKPHIIVGSAGRILELIKMRKIAAHTVKTIVIDEGDRMLDENNLSTVKDIIKTTMKDRQLMIYSATINEKTSSIAKSLTKDAEVVRIEDKELVSETIDHMYFTAEQRDKIEVLRKLVAALKPEKGIVFINKSEDIAVITSKLQYHYLKADSIFGSTTKEERKKTMEDFRRGNLQLLVASDLAARGLDVEGVTHIFNLNLPRDSKDYLHRVGRTGRAGKSGTAISIVTKEEIPILRKYEKDFNIKIAPKKVFKGEVMDDFIPVRK